MIDHVCGVSVGFEYANHSSLSPDLDSLGVKFVSLRDGFDLTTPSGKLMFHVVGAMAEFERSLIRERILSGLARAKRYGKRLGRKSLMLSPSKLRRLVEAKTSLWRCPASLAVRERRSVRP